MKKSEPPAWVVHKFGGSSVADAACFERVAAIVESRQFASSTGGERLHLAVVLSACKGVTDALLELVRLAEQRDNSWRGRLAALRVRHAGIAEQLLDDGATGEYLSEFDRDLADLTGVLETTSVMRSAAQTVSDLAAGFGEIWSTRLFTASCSGAASAPACSGWMRAAASKSSGGRWGRPCTGRNHAPSCRRCAARPGWRPQHAGHHRVHRHRSARRADHARTQWQRLLGLNFRRAA